MTVAVKEVTKQGETRWVRSTCPCCGHTNVTHIYLGKPRQAEAECLLGCQAKYVITWDEQDESVT